jgi:hypothetical protein
VYLSAPVTLGDEYAMLSAWTLKEKPSLQMALLFFVGNVVIT